MAPTCPPNVDNNPAIKCPQSTGQQSYGFKYGADPMSNSHGAIENFNKNQDQMNQHHRGGGITPGSCPSTGGKMVVPQFPTFNPAGPDGGDSASSSNGLTKLTQQRQAKFDEFAFCGTEAPPPSTGVPMGGGRPSRRRRRRSRRGRKHKYTKVKKVRRYRRTKRRKSRKGRKTKRSKKIKVIRNLKW